MNRYRQARIRAGYSQKKAAFMLGVSSPSMSDWENGKTRPTNKHLKEMAKLYGTTTDYLIGADGNDSDEMTVGEEEMRVNLINKIKRMRQKELAKVLLFVVGIETGKEIYAVEDEGK